MSDLSLPLDLHHSLRRATASARRQHPWSVVELAERLQVSPGELVAAHAGLHARHESPLKAVRLQPFWPGTLSELERWGPLTLWAPSAGVSLSARTRLRGHSPDPGRGALQALDLPLHMACHFAEWAHAFALQDDLPCQVERSVQVFDAQGEPLLQLTLGPHSDLDAYASWVARSASPALAAGLRPPVRLPRRAAAPAPCPPASVVREAWLATRDHGDGAQLQTRWGLSRHQLLTLADPAYVQAIDPAALPELFMQLAQHQVDWHCQTGQRGWSLDGCGQWLDVRPRGGWLRANDPRQRVQLALREEAVASAWRVRHPCSQGLLSQLELFDARQQPLMCLRGAATPQRPAPATWHALLARAADAAPDCALA